MIFNKELKYMTRNVNYKPVLTGKPQATRKTFWGKFIDFMTAKGDF